MINGQLNVVSMPAVAQSVMQEATASAAITTDGAQQDGGHFAGMLSGIQAQVKVKELSDSGTTEQPSLKVDAEILVSELLAGLSVLPHVTPTPESAGTKAEDQIETAGDSADGLSQRSEVTELAAQMVLAASLQPGRMPEANIEAPRAVDALQNVASVSGQPVAIIAHAAEKLTEQVLPEQQPETSSQVGRESQLTQQSEATLTAATDTSSAAKSDRMSDVSSMTAIPVERLQATPVQMAVTNVSIIVAEPLQDEPTEAQGTKKADLVVAVADASLDGQSNASVAPPLESELEIQLSQPQPITARVTPTAVLAGNRSAASGQVQSVGQRLNPEQQIENVRKGNEHIDVKEMTSTLQSSESASGSTFGSGTPQDGESKQDQSDSTTNNQMLAQNMRVQLGSEHQKVSALSVKAVSGEPLQQNAPEQIVQQVKEHLQLHDVKPGSQQITLTLSPDSLGELKMNLNLQGQKLSVEIVTENRSVRDVIIQHTDALKESLARQNITMESFDVTTGGKGSGNQGQNQNAWRELAQQQQQQSWVSPRGYQVAQADLPTGQATYQRAQGQSMLDIHY